ncbi:MAG: hypothetical protein AMJ88_04155 [Anaerolineae bacterium SM23_ 63]|nr:MAG: hypothetical protein AMJ88_04155 [Anaerolineae bacterium SM23_ 63]
MNTTFNRAALVLVILTMAITACGQLISESDFGKVGDVDTPTSEVDENRDQVDQTEAEPLPTEDPMANEEQPVIDGSLFWSEVIDDRTGLRFAVPCFWQVNLPDLDPGGLGAFSIRNYDEAFVLAHPRSHISEDEGAIKIDMAYFQPSSLSLPTDTNLGEFALAITDDELSELLDTEEVLVNHQQALLVTNRDTRDDSTYQYHLFGISDDLILLFSVWPQSALATPDVRGVLNSIAIAREVNVQIPQIIPGNPPLGVPAPCLKGFETTSDQTDLSGTLSCQAAEVGSAEELACHIQAALLVRDMQTLASLMSDPFTIGYWGSEGGWASPMDMVNEISHNRLPADTSGLTFTTDRNVFPPLQGMPPERMFGPDIDVALIIYSEGWGGDGGGAALLYIVQDSGEYYWHSMVYSHVHFDK